MCGLALAIRWVRFRLSSQKIRISLEIGRAAILGQQFGEKMNRSQLASHFGKLVEIKAAERFGLRLDHSEVAGSSTRVDARDGQGRPWDVKGAMSNRKTGPGRFRLWKDQHDVLKENGGGYVFVWYQGRSDGIAIHKMRSVSAEDVSVRWGGSGSHRRDSQQAKILARSVFE